MAELEDEAGTMALGDMVGHHPSKLLQCFEAVDAKQKAPGFSSGARFPLKPFMSQSSAGGSESLAWMRSRLRPYPLAVPEVRA